MTLVLEIGWTEETTEVVVVDTAARSKVGEGRCTNLAPVDGLVDAATWWPSVVRATRHAIDGLTALGLPADDLRSVLIAPGEPTGGLVALGADGAPVHDAVVGSHPGSGADADWLIGQLDGGAEAWRAATDVLPTAGSTVALLSWFHRSAPEAWAAATRFTLPAGYLLERLGGDAAVSSADAVGTAVLDLHTGDQWRTDLLAVVDVERDWVTALPTVALTAAAVGQVSHPAGAELGIPAGLPLHVGRAGLG
jgi:sugar (pentulose or hexulose) kinase